MAAYFSEVGYQDAPINFFEVAVPAGTDVSGYSIAIYDASGVLQATIGFPAPAITMQGSDVYVFEETTPGYAEYGASEAIALIDGSGTVLQFVSFEGKTVTPTSGPAAGETSSDLGFLNSGETFETHDDGSTYYVQGSPNPGAIPCYARGTLIETPSGPRPVEDLRVGDLVWTAGQGALPARWLSGADQPLEHAAPDACPVLIRAGALGPACPSRDLIVSPQHRILAGARGQLEGMSRQEVFVPAKALTDLPGIRFMRGRQQISWHHFALETHAVVVAEGCLSESPLLGPVVLGGLERSGRSQLRAVFGPAYRGPVPLNGRPARACLAVNEAPRLASAWKTTRATRSITA